MATLLISDLHLSSQRPDIVERFLAFCEQDAHDAEALYILGDLFEYWIGDDAVEALGYQEVLSVLAKLSEHGVKLYFMHGNRDFLIGKVFADQTGCNLLKDPTLIELDNQSVLLMHGDSLCTDDVKHQRFRKMVNNPLWQRQFLKLPITARKNLALGARAASESNKSTTSMEIMDVNEQAVITALQEHNVSLLIHGHTHRPAVHDLEVDGKPARRIVLGDWYEQSSALRCDQTGFELSAGNQRHRVSVPFATAGNL